MNQRTLDADGFYKTSKEEITLILCNLFQKNRSRRTYFLTHSMRPDLPNLDKDKKREIIDQHLSCFVLLFLQRWKNPQKISKSHSKIYKNKCIPQSSRIYSRYTRLFAIQKSRNAIHHLNKLKRHNIGSYH